MSRPRLLLAAEQELLDAVFWYEAEKPGLGLEFLAAFEALLDEIGESPERSPEWPANRAFRRALLRRFPYLVFFRILDFGVQIVAVAHAKRRAGYWVSRAAPLPTSPRRLSST